MEKAEAPDAAAMVAAELASLTLVKAACELADDNPMLALAFLLKSIQSIAKNAPTPALKQTCMELIEATQRTLQGEDGESILRDISRRSRSNVTTTTATVTAKKGEC